MYEIRHYVTPDGKDLFETWVQRIRDMRALLQSIEGGDKGSQKADIARAVVCLREWEARKHAR